MLPIGGGLPHCKNCGVELEGDELNCPHCGFDPRNKGLRVASLFLIIVVVAVLLSFLSVFILPALGSILLSLAAGSFAIALIIFFISFVATPYRFGTLFKF